MSVLHRLSRVTGGNTPDVTSFAQGPTRPYPYAFSPVGPSFTSGCVRGCGSACHGSATDLHQLRDGWQTSTLPKARGDAAAQREGTQWGLSLLVNLFSGVNISVS